MINIIINTINNNIIIIIITIINVILLVQHTFNEKTIKNKQ